MCLRLDEDFPKPTETKIVYKLYSRLFYNKEGNEYQNYYQYGIVLLKPGQYVKSNRRYLKLTKNEKLLGKVVKGLHAYTSKSRHYSDCYTIVAAMESNPKDFVAGGFFNQQECVVYKKLRFLRFV